MSTQWSPGKDMSTQWSPGKETRTQYCSSKGYKYAGLLVTVIVASKSQVYQENKGEF